MLEALLIAGVAMVLTAPDGMAAGTASTESNPADELWRAYPLEQTTTATGASSTRPSNAPARSPAPAPDRGDGTPWIALLLAACAVGLAAAAVPVVRRRLAGSRRPTNDGATAATPAAEQNAYVQHNLVSDGFLPADHTDANLVNAWGLTSLPGSPRP